MEGHSWLIIEVIIALPLNLVINQWTCETKELFLTFCKSNVSKVFLPWWLYFRCFHWEHETLIDLQDNHTVRWLNDSLWKVLQKKCPLADPGVELTSRRMNGSVCPRSRCHCAFSFGPITQFIMQELCPFSCSSPRLSIVRGHLPSPRRTILQERLNSSKSHRAVLRGMAGMVSGSRCGCPWTAQRLSECCE